MSEIEHNSWSEYSPEVSDIEEVKSTFIRNVEHELRTPVTIIQGYAELLSKGMLGELQPQQIEAISAITIRAHELRILVERITTLLAVRTEAVRPMAVGLIDILVAVTEARREHAEQAGLSLEVQVDEELPYVQGYPEHLEQALDCIIDNAIKFTPAGGLVEVKAYTEGKWLCLKVADTGIGIPEDKLAHIFSSFYQIDDEGGRRYGGLGLGLTVAKAVIESYSGRIEVVSQPKVGSQFIVRLPKLSYHPSGEDDDMDMRENRLGKQRILVVDDEEFVAVTLQDGLEKLPNCEVEIATSADKALELLEGKNFDLVFTDYKMPDVDGLTLATKIRELYPTMQIIMITAYSDDKLTEQAADIDIRQVFNKPVAFTEVRQAAMEILDTEGNGE